MTKQENPNPDPTQLLKNNDQKYQNAIEIFCRAKKGCRDMYNILFLKKEKHIPPMK